MVAERLAVLLAGVLAAAIRVVQRPGLRPALTDRMSMADSTRQRSLRSCIAQPTVRRENRSYRYMVGVLAKPHWVGWTMTIFGRMRGPTGQELPDKRSRN